MLLQLVPNNLLRELDVDRGCFEVCVSQHLLNGPRGRPLRHVMGGKGVTEGVNAGPFDPCLGQMLFHHLLLQLLHTPDRL